MKKSMIGLWIIAAAFSASALIAAPALGHEDAGYFAKVFETANLVGEPEIVDCKLSGGTETKCIRITVRPEPKTYAPGPWCPQNATDGPDKAGIWLDNGKVYDADGAFMSALPEFYSDKKWQLVDPETGNINVTDTKEACAAAARPDVDAQYNNFCVQCLTEYVDPELTMTYTIPLEPQDRYFTRSVGFAGSGLAFNGVRLDGPAPVDAILGAYTIAPFDDCGGHVNLHVGYHYHAATECLDTSAQKQAHAPEIGLAMDGYKIMSHRLTDGTLPSDLDKCNGHLIEGIGYHYHAGEEGSNAILSCFKAEYGCASDDPDAVCDATARPPRP